MAHVTNHYLFCSKECPLPIPHCAIYILKQLHLEHSNSKLLIQIPPIPRSPETHPNNLLLNSESIPYHALISVQFSFLHRSSNLSDMLDEWVGVFCIPHCLYHQFLIVLPHKVLLWEVNSALPIFSHHQLVLLPPATALGDPFSP